MPATQVAPVAPVCYGNARVHFSKFGTMSSRPYQSKYAGPLSEGSTPDYLNGEFPGDYGWDTAGLSADPETFSRYREIGEWRP